MKTETRLLTSVLNNKRTIMIKFLTMIALLVVLMQNNSFSQKKKLQLRHGESTINSVHFLPDGKQLVSTSFDGTVVMWNTTSGKRVWELDLDGKTRTKDRYTISHILEMVTSPDGNIISVSYSLASVIGETLQADNVYQIVLLDAKSGQVKKTLIGHTFLTSGLSFSPDGKLLLSVSGDQTARLWNVDTGKETLQIKLKEKGGIPIFMPDGKQFIIALGPIDGLPPQPIVGLYDAESGRLLREFPKQGYRYVEDMVLSPDGKFLVIGGFSMPDVTTRIWNLDLPDTQEPKIILAEDKKFVGNYVFSPEGTLLAYSEFKNGKPMVAVREFLSDKIIKTYKVNDEVESLDFSPNETQLAIGTRKGQILLVPINLP